MTSVKENGDGKFKNPYFGVGVFKRFIRITHNNPGEILAVLADDCHAFRIILCHDDKAVTAIKVEWERHPTTTCPGAVDAIQAIVGMPLNKSILELRRQLNAKVQCTHILDLSLFAVVHAVCQRDSKTYKIYVPDSLTDDIGVRVECNGSLVLNAKGKGGVFIKPDNLKGAPLNAGFFKWIAERADPGQVEFLVMAQMACFVAISRRYDQNAMVGMPTSMTGPARAACYAVQPERVDESFRLPSSLIVSDGYDFRV